MGMTRDRAVEAAMKEVRSGSYTDSQLQQLEALFPLLWQAGAEEKGRELGTRNLKAVRQLDREGNELQTYPSIKDAALATGYLYDTLQRAIDRGALTHRGRYYWEKISA
jgi:hypothetical protein